MTLVVPEDDVHVICRDPTAEDLKSLLLCCLSEQSMDGSDKVFILEDVFAVLRAEGVEISDTT